LQGLLSELDFHSIKVPSPFRFRRGERRIRADIVLGLHVSYVVRAFEMQCGDLSCSLSKVPKTEQNHHGVKEAPETFIKTDIDNH
jgi:hypothetical protein